MKDDEEWYGVGMLSRWAWDRALDRPAAFCALCAIAGTALAYANDESWKAILAGLTLIVATALAITASMVVSLFSDGFAEQLLHKIFKQPNPKNPLHQLTHIILSVIVFVPLLILMTGDDTR